MLIEDLSAENLGENLLNISKQSLEFENNPDKELDEELEEKKVSSSFQFDNMYNTLKKELYVISEEDQTSYRETN